MPQVTSDAPKLPSLRVLRLGSNRLTSLSDRSFSACPALTELYLDHNAIGSLSDHTFSGLRNLKVRTSEMNQQLQIEFLVANIESTAYKPDNYSDKLGL